MRQQPMARLKSILIAKKFANWLGGVFPILHCHLFTCGTCFVFLAVSSFAASPVYAAAKKARRGASPTELVATGPQWGLHLFSGVSAGRTRLVELVPMPWSGDYGDNYFVGGAVSRRLGRIAPDWIVDLEVGAGYRFKQVNAPETWAAAFLRYDGFFWNRYLYTTAAISTGLSYVTRVSDIEKDAGSDRGSPNGSKVLHYLAPEFTFALPERRDSELVIRFHHRSGAFGTFNGVWGGSNVVTVGFRQRW